jgi:hypothetical protein
MLNIFSKQVLNTPNLRFKINHKSIVNRKSKIVNTNYIYGLFNQNCHVRIQHF